MSEQPGPSESHPVVSRGSSDMHSFATNMRMRLLAIIAILVVVVVVALLAMGYLVIAWKQPAKQAVIISKQVCGDDMVRTYNDASLYERRGSNNDFSVDKAGLDKLKSDITSKAGYQDDPTCQTILLMVAVNDEDYTAAKEAYSAVARLHDQHQYANSGLNTGTSLLGYERLVEALAPVPNNAKSQGPQGGA